MVYAPSKKVKKEEGGKHVCRLGTMVQDVVINEERMMYHAPSPAPIQAEMETFLGG